jgi:hypothetical protein
MKPSTKTAITSRAPTHRGPHHAGNRALLLAAAASLAFPIANAALAQPCTGTWSDRFALPGVTAQISDTVIWDDGTGPALYAVGSFGGREIGRIALVTDTTNPGGTTTSGAYHIARWDGRNWNIVGQTPILQDDPTFSVQRLNTIEVFDPDGPGPLPSSLIVGGQSNFGASPNPFGTLRFDGTTWTRFGTTNLSAGGTDEVRDLQVFNGELYAVGRFVNSPIGGLAKWDVDLQDWVNASGAGIPLPSSNNRVERMAVGDADGDGTPEMYIGGTFGFSVTGGTANRLVRFDGANFFTVPGWTNTSTAIAANLGGPSILRFIDLGDGPSLLVGDAIYAGLTSPANTRGVALARLRNGTWSTLLAQTASGTFKSYVFAAEMFPGPDGQQLHIGGQRLLNGLAGQPVGVSLARRSAAGTWSPLTTFAPTNLGTVAWMRPIDWDAAGPEGTKLLFGATQYRFGNIGTFGDFEPVGIALWDGANVQPAHSGAAPLSVAASMFRELDPDGPGPQGTTLFVGHVGTRVAGRPASGLLTFDGTSFQQTPTGIAFPIAVETLTTGSGTSLYATGEVANGGGPALLRLDGTTWTNLGQPNFDGDEVLPPAFDTMTTATVNGEPSLVIAGRFREVAGVASRFIIRYNGTNWIPMDAGLPGPTGVPGQTFRTNASFQQVFNLNGTLFANIRSSYYDTTLFSEILLPGNLFRWDGATWQPFAPYEGTNFVLDLGSGPELYALRNKEPAPNASYVARWNGTSFVQVGPGFTWANPTATASRITTVTAHNFGQGKRLVVAVDSPGVTNGATAEGLMYLENGQWLPITGTSFVRGTAFMFSSDNPTWGGLYVRSTARGVGYTTVNAGGVESQGIARYINGVCTCGPSDIAGPGPTVGPDGELTADDIILFISWFTASDTRADVASPGPVAGPDGELTADDVILFINRFTAGC